MKYEEANSFDIAENTSINKKPYFFRDKEIEIKTIVEQKKSNKKKIIIILIFIISSLIIFTFLEKTGILSKCLKTLQKKLKSLSKTNHILSLFLMFLLIFIIFIFALPGQMIGSIFCVIIISNFLKSFFYLSLFSILSSTITYILTLLFCGKCLKKTFKDNKIVKLLEKEAFFRPFKTSCITRSLFLNAGVKDYMLILVDVPFWSYFLSSVIFNGGYSLLYSLIGSEISQIEEFIDHPKSWEHKSVYEKISLIVLGISVFLTVFFFIFIGCWAKKKLKENNDKKDIEFNEFNKIKRGSNFNI